MTAVEDWWWRSLPKMSSLFCLVAVLTLASSFCFTKAPLAAVRMLFSIMNAYPSRSKAKSALQNTEKCYKHWVIFHFPSCVMIACRSGKWGSSHLAAIKAPKIIVTTVSLIEAEKVFLWWKTKNACLHLCWGWCRQNHSPTCLREFCLHE